MPAVSTSDPSVVCLIKVFKRPSSPILIERAVLSNDHADKGSSRIRRKSLGCVALRRQSTARSWCFRDGSQRSEVRCQSSETRGQRSEVGGETTEFGHLMLRGRK